MFITTVLTGIDLWCKQKIEENFHAKEEKAILKEKVILRKVHNKGMAFNFAQEHPEKVKVVSGIACGLVGIFSVFIWIKETCPWKKLGASLAFAGAISNTYDRFVRGHVVDYFSFRSKWKKLARLTFNLGDIFLLLGSLILTAAELYRNKK